MQVTLTCPRKGKLKVVAKRGEVEVFRDTFNPDTASERKRILLSTGLSEAAILSAADKFAENKDGDPVVADIVQAESPAFVCTRREITSACGEEFRGDPRTAFLSSMDVGELGGRPSDNVVEWTGTERLAVLDIDYHGIATPEREQVLNALARISPAPWLVWFSRGGGLHCVYYDTGVFTAGELAACAGLAYLGVDPTATFEVISRTRLPSGEVIQQTQTSDPTAIAKWLRTTVSDEQVEDFLGSAGLEKQNSYDHSHCPFNNTEGSHGKPVFVGDAGLFCQHCSARGFICGSRKPGFFPYATLIHGGTPDVIRLMGENFTHYEHARLVLSDVAGVNGTTAQLAYGALLKMLHGHDDRRIEAVFFGGNNLVRLDNRWATRDAIVTYRNNETLNPILANLPACQYADGKPNPERIARFRQAMDLTEYGYPAVTPIRGIRIYSRTLPFTDTDRISVVVPTDVLRSPANERYRPKYIPADGRISDPWAVVEESFPGVHRNFVKLLIAAKGVAEGQVGLAPNILVRGPTASGKSLMVSLAATLCGDHNTEVPWQKSVERFRQGVSSGADQGTYVTVNEVFKDADRNSNTAVQALDVFLNLTPDSVSHKLYVGPVPLGRVPVCVVTDIGVPQVLRNDLQLARRFVYVRLDESHPEWVGTLAGSGLYQVQRFRVMDERHAAAADAIVSEVIDTFFDRPRTLADIAGDLGFSLLCDSQDFDDPSEELRKFYDAVCNAAELPEKYLTRWVGRGWKLVQPGDETALADAWSSVNDGEEGKKWYESRRAGECDWKRLLKSPTDVRFETRKFRNLLVVRFRSGELNESYRVNQEIVK